MAHILAVSNQKGGVGKTTTVTNVAAYAALSGQRTLVIDNDPQGNATSVLLPRDAGPSLYAHGQPQVTRIANLWISPGGHDLLAQETRLATDPRGRHRLSALLAPLLPAFDLVLIDCPPSLSLLPANALLAAHRLLIPIQCEYFAMEGLSQLLHVVGELNDLRPEPLGLAGLLLTMFDDQLALSRDVAAELRRHFPEQVFRSTIPRDVALAAAPSHSQTIAEYDPLSKGSLAYLSATKEVLHGLR